MALWDVILYLESGWFCTNACGRILDVRVILNNFLIYVYIFEKKILKLYGQVVTILNSPYLSSSQVLVKYYFYSNFRNLMGNFKILQTY